MVDRPTSGCWQCPAVAPGRGRLPFSCWCHGGRCGWTMTSPGPRACVADAGRDPTIPALLRPTAPRQCRGSTTCPARSGCRCPDRGRKGAARSPPGTAEAREGSAVVVGRIRARSSGCPRRARRALGGPQRSAGVLAQPTQWARQTTCLSGRHAEGGGDRRTLDPVTVPHQASVRRRRPLLPGCGHAPSVGRRIGRPCLLRASGLRASG